jgi:hypothetical protein
MSSLVDGFGGGVDDMVSVNTRVNYGNLFWEVGYHGFSGVPLRRASVPTSTAPEAISQTAILELHGGHHLVLLRHVAAATPSRSHVLHQSRTFAIWWRITREPKNSSRTPCPRSDC